MNLLTEFKKLKRWQQASWIVLVVILFVYFISLYYSDIIITYMHSLNFLDCIRNGNLLGFYEYSVEHPFGGHPADYFISSYILFGLWNLPCYIVSRSSGEMQDYVALSSGALLWCKVLLILFTVFTVRELVKLLKRLYIEAEKALFVFLSSLFFVLPTYAVAQYDIIQVFFILWGINRYIKDEGISWRCLLIFSIATSFKAYAIFALLILVLLEEKNVIKIIIDVILGGAFTVLSMLPFTKGYILASSNANEGNIGRLSELAFSLGKERISVFWLAFIGLCIVAYLQKRNDITSVVKKYMYFMLCFFAMYYSFSETNPYTLVMMIPFIIVVMSSRENKVANTLLELGMEIGITLMFAAHIDSCIYLSEMCFGYLSFSKVVVNRFPESLLSAYLYGGLTLIAPITFALFVACVVGMLIINNPWKHISTNGVFSISVEKVDTYSRAFRLFMLVTYFVVAVLNVVF